MTRSFYRKIGGIHWFSLGPYRLSFCHIRKAETPNKRIGKTGWIGKPKPTLPKVTDGPQIVH